MVTGADEGTSCSLAVRGGNLFVCPTEHMQAGSGVERSKDSEHLPSSTQLLLVSCTPGALGSSNWDWGIGEDGPSEEVTFWSQWN